MKVNTLVMRFLDDTASHEVQGQLTSLGGYMCQGVSFLSVHLHAQLRKLKKAMLNHA